MAGRDALDGTRFGRYLLVERLGGGGMGDVWRANDTGTDRVVAIKLLHAHFSENEEFKRRFRREAHAAARLDTPHVIPIHDYGEIDGRLYVCMRLIEGRDLQNVLADGPLDPARAVRIIEQVAKALHAAHRVGLLHRDIKPSNILLDDDDFAYLIDFGIARALDETRMTKSGQMIGTFAYIAPERLDPRIEEDARADIYSLACVLYEALTGQPPFDGTTKQLIAAHLNTLPPRPSTTQPNLPKQIDAVIAKGMAKDPENRYVTTIELADAAHDAITVPIPRPTPSAAPTRSDPIPAAAVEQRDNKTVQQPTQLAQNQPAEVPKTPPEPDIAAPSSFWATEWGWAISLAGAIIIIATVIAIMVIVGHSSRRYVSSPTMSGHYIRTETNPSSGQSVDDDWYVTSCGAGCASVAAMPDGPATQARLVNGRWTMDADGVAATCPDGSSVPNAITNHFTWDPETFAGTDQITVNVPACGEPVGYKQTNNIQLRHAA